MRLTGSIAAGFLKGGKTCRATFVRSRAVSCHAHERAVRLVLDSERQHGAQYRLSAQFAEPPPNLLDDAQCVRVPPHL